MVQMVKMDVLQAGANVAVTQLKSNNCDEGQLCFFFFFFLPPLLLCAGDWAEFQSLLFSHSDSVARRKKKKKCPSPTFAQEIHHFAFCVPPKKIPGPKDDCLRRSVGCHSLRVMAAIPEPFLAIRSHTHSYAV